MRPARAGTGIEAPGLLAAARRLVPIVVFAAIPAAALCLLLQHSLATPARLAFWDFHAVWGAGRDVLDGRSPYPSVDPNALEGQQAFVYPAPAAIMGAVFAALPFHAASAVFAVLSVAAVLLALRIAGVRDWRLYGLALMTRPFLHGLSLGAVTPFLTLGLAVAWRWRDRRWVVAGAVAALVVLKVFLWPLLLWLAFTRRLASAVLAFALTVVVTLAGWAVIGFAGLHSYPHLLSVLSRLLEGKGYSVVALGLSVGLSVAAAKALAVMTGLACVAAIAWPGRRSGRDEWTLCAALGAALALSPIVWLHYFTLLLVPLAIASPRLSRLWLLPLAFWAVGGQSVDPAVWDRGWTSSSGLSTGTVGGVTFVAYGLGVAALTLTACALKASRRREAGLERAVRAQSAEAREPAVVQ